MTPQSDVLRDFPVESRAAAAPAAIPESRRFYWSVRRELWENRAIYVAPLAVAALIVVGFLVGLIRLRTMHAATNLDPDQLRQLAQMPYTFAALLLMGTTFLVSVFYCLDALYGERRDRSILFWKSLPVSDLTSVLAKMTIPVIVLPLLTFAVTVVTQALMLLISTTVLLGWAAAPQGSSIPLLQMSLMDLYHLLAVHGLWYAPVYAWLLLVSAFARRAPLLWAILPPLAIGVAEKIAFNTSYFARMIGYRLSGAPGGAPFNTQDMTMEPLSHLNPGAFLANPHLWSGLVLAAIFLAVAIRLRRSHGPI
jgi:ABC-2 type transport system permease protein